MCLTLISRFHFESTGGRGKKGGGFATVSSSYKVCSKQEDKIYFLNLEFSERKFGFTSFVMKSLICTILINNMMVDRIIFAKTFVSRIYDFFYSSLISLT